MSLESQRSTLRESSPSAERNWLGYVLACMFAFGAFLSGLHFGQQTSNYAVASQPASIFSGLFASEATQAVVDPDTMDLSSFWEVWGLLEDKFAVGSSSSEVTIEDRIQGAIDGLVGAYGDPYTVYMPPEDAATFNENISGNFSGVGMEVGLREGLVTVIAPLPDTPAEKAGIVAGDIVVKIDEVSTEDMRLDEAVSLIRGEKGTVVTLQVYREGETEFLDIQITRDTISIPTVRTEEADGAFIISIYSFNGVAEEQVRDALQEYLVSDATSLVLDLRGNPGGYLQSAVAIASYFLPAGKVVVKEEFSDHAQDEIFRSRGRQIKLFTPQDFVVLVDNGSASASEILAGALQDHGVATVIGSQTFGKGSVQELVELTDGASLKVTVARWLTPNGTSISDGGLTPDIVIGRTPAERIAGEDPQKAAALRFLAGEEVVSETFEDELADSASSTDETGE